MITALTILIMHHMKINNKKAERIKRFQIKCERKSLRMEKPETEGDKLEIDEKEGEHVEYEHSAIKVDTR